MELVDGVVGFTSKCTCRQPGCAHRTAVALKALERFPALRKAAPKAAATVLDIKPQPERRRLVLEISPGAAAQTCVACVPASVRSISC